MRRLSAWVTLAVLTSSCGLTVGFRTPGQSDAAGRPIIRLAAATTLEEGAVAASTPSAGEDASAPPDAVVEGEPSPSTDDTPESTPDEQQTAGTTAPATGSTSSPRSESDPTTSTAVAISTTTAEVVSTTTEPAIEATMFSEDEAFVTHQCNGNGVTIAGEAGDYTLEGSCGSVVITGSFNTVFIDEVDSIELTGTLNAVIYISGDPVINDYDGDNIVTAG